ncbi:MAG: hypothetical protein GY718_04590 [Lentisphaerae bacterium]|nr:hypothetical protein [Lentisphaerota bacterium]
MELTIELDEAKLTETIRAIADNHFARNSYGSSNGSGYDLLQSQVIPQLDSIDFKPLIQTAIAKIIQGSLVEEAVEFSIRNHVKKVLAKMKKEGGIDTLFSKP